METWGFLFFYETPNNIITPSDFQTTAKSKSIQNEFVVSVS